jgi:type II secretory ATPase GspE/PulE/Tfp pilus assembly ATPase PilB-like protein
MEETKISLMQPGHGLEGVATLIGGIQKKSFKTQARPGLKLLERPLRPQLAKNLLDLLAGYATAAEHSEYLAHRAELPPALVADAVKARASDIHIEPFGDGVRIRLRIDGILSDVANVSAEQGKWLSNQFKAVVNLDPIVRFTPKDSHGHIPLNGGTMDIRLALAPSQRGEIISIRLLDPKRLERSLGELGLTQLKLQQLDSWLENVSGMFLCAGPTGSGKTTTVYALLHQLKFADRAIVSIEDPVEYEVTGINQVQLDERHHLSFAEGVKSMLRLDPDFVMIGEIRDAASAHAAVDAAITGRVLLSTVHARDAVATVTALRNWGLPDHEIAESLSVVVAQRLVRCLCPECMVSGSATENEKRWLAAFGLEAPKQVWLPKGCAKCNGIGYLGRTGIFELWRLAEADYELILAHADEHRLRAEFRKTAQGGLLRDGLCKVIDGTTSLSEVRRASGGAFPWEALENAEQ